MSALAGAWTRMKLFGRIRPADLAYASGVLLGLALLAGGLLRTHMELASRNDFAEMWAAARIVLSGGDPYDPTGWRTSLAQLVGRHANADVFLYPPYVLPLFIPFALLPVSVASLLWTYGGLALAVVATRSLLRALVPPRPVTYALFAFALVASQPALVAIAQGQWSFLLVAALSVAVVSLRAGHQARAGAAALAVLAKPALLLFGGWALVSAGAARRQWAFLMIVALGFAGAAASWLLARDSWITWLNSATESVLSGRHVRATTLASLSAESFGSAGPVLAAAAVLAAVLVALAFDRRGDAHLAVWLALSVAVAQYAQIYDHLLLLVPLIIATGVLARRSPTRSLALAAAGVALLVVGEAILYAVTVSEARDRFGAAAPLATFVLITALVWPQRGERAKPV